MAEETKPVETKTEIKPTETAKVIPEKTVPVETKTETKTDVKTETKDETKPAAVLKTLLDEATEKELDKDGKPIVAQEKVVPEKYEFKLPEGFTMDEAQLALITPAFKELGLDNAGAQKLLDLQMAYNKQNEEAHVKSFDQYVENLKTESKEYFGTKLPEVMRNVARARDTLMPKTADGKEHPLQEKLNISGLANDKDFLEFFDKVGRVIGEGKFIEGKRSAPAAGKAGQETASEKEITLNEVYPSMAKT